MTPMEAAVAVRNSLIKTFGEENTVDLMLWDAEKCADAFCDSDAEAAIVWEGAPLHDWAIEISMRAPVLALPGILAEPYNGHILNFYTVEG